MHDRYGYEAEGTELICDDRSFDYQMLCYYISEDMNGVVLDEQYSDTYGQDRITIRESR